jgi:hypothetical protein
MVPSVATEKIPSVMSPWDRTPIQTGTALDVRSGARNLVTPLAVWAAQLRDAKVPRGCENQDRTHNAQ